MTSGTGRLGLLLSAGMWACSGDHFAPIPSNGGAGGGAGTVAAGGNIGTAGSAGTAGAANAGAAGAFAGAAGEGPVAGAGGTEGGNAGNASGGASGAGAGGNGAGGNGGGGAGAPGCAIVHVAASGTLQADGCTEQTPVRTLAAGLAAARKRAADGKPVAEIRVCAGVFEETEPLILDLPVKVRGSWACGSSPWALPAELTAQTASSSIVYAAATGLRITDAGPQAASFEGFYLTPGQPPPKGVPSVCVEIAPGAAPLLDRDNLCQTSVLASGPSFGAIGVSVGAGSNAVIRSSVISTALGTAEQVAPVPTAGSIGVLIDDPGPSFGFENNRVVVKEGAVRAAGRPATMGVLLRAGNAGATLIDNVIGAGEGRYLGANLEDVSVATASLGSGLVVVRAAGAQAAGAPIVVRGGSVRGGAGSATAKGPAGFAAGGVTYGIEVGQNGPTPLELRLERVRVYGGDPVVAPHPTVTSRFSASYGLAVTGARVTSVSSLVHGGGLLRKTGAPRAVVLFQNASLDASLTTIVGGEIAPDPALGPTGRNQILVQFAGASATAKLRRSLLVGSDVRSFAFFAGGLACTARGNSANETGYLVDTDDTAYVHYETASPDPAGPGPTAFVSGQPGCPVLATSTTPRDFAAASHFAGTLTVIGRPQASTPVVSLPNCNDTPSCLKILFPGYDPSQPSEVLALLDPSLRPACLAGFPPILRGPPGSPADAIDDLMGVPRKSAKAVGIGAFVPACQ